MVTRRIAALAIGLLAVLALVAVVGDQVAARLDPFNRAPFSREEWRTADLRAAKCSRGPMARDLQRRILRPGMTRREVVALLGRPTETYTCRGPASAHYYLGCWTEWFVCIDGDVLCMQFDRAGRLMTAEIHGT